jgi:hypothetical protein
MGYMSVRESLYLAESYIGESPTVVEAEIRKGNFR